MNRRYRPIENYGVIGNMRTIALVCLDGSIDWCCLPRIDDPSIFGALLDAGKGGRFMVRARGVELGQQRYLQHTNVLETVFVAERGRLVVTDFMPIRGDAAGCSKTRCEHALFRLIRAEGGPVEVEFEWSPRFDYGRGRPQILRTHSGFIALSKSDALTLGGLPTDARIEEDTYGQLVRAEFELQPGERRALVTRWGVSPAEVPPEAAQQNLAETVDVWRTWVNKEAATGGRRWAGAHSELIIRSELTLKLLTHSDTGAIAAAATLGLPEEIGGLRNWDYRYSWIRDAALSAQALFALGHREEAIAFIRWTERSAQQRGEHSWGLQIVYALDGEDRLREEELVHLEGYRRSGPVRIGNGAYGQLQLDVYGELISAAYELARMGVELDPQVRAFLPHLADKACAAYGQADYGVWEVRNGPFQFVYSKAMVWMALERAARLHRSGVVQGNVVRWESTMVKVREELLDRGFDAKLGSFKQAYERSVLDASNLLLPMLEVLPFDDPRVQGTIDQTLQHLTVNGLVYRYQADDGVAGGEGAFVLCSFWLVDVLALSGRLDEAHRIYEGLLGRANHLGLYSEQIDPGSGAFLGNFPQAFSHIGVINSTLYLAYKEGRSPPIAAPIGSPEHRAQRS